MNKIEKISLSVDKFEELIEANAQLIKRYGIDFNLISKNAIGIFLPAIAGGVAMSQFIDWKKDKEEKAKPSTSVPASSAPVAEEAKEAKEAKETKEEKGEEKETDEISDGDGDGDDLDLSSELDSSDDEQSPSQGTDSPVSSSSGGSKRIDPKFQKMINYYLEKYEPMWKKEKLEEDGAWGQKTQEALDFVSSLYDNKYKFKTVSDLANFETLYDDFVASQKESQTTESLTE